MTSAVKSIAKAAGEAVVLLVAVLALLTWQGRGKTMRHHAVPHDLEVTASVVGVESEDCRAEALAKPDQLLLQHRRSELRLGEPVRKKVRRNRTLAGAQSLASTLRKLSG